MNLQPDDPRLTHYLLGELPPDEATAVEHALAADPALRLALDDLLEIRQALTDTLAPGTDTLSPAQRETILRAARDADRGGAVFLLDPRQWAWRRWQIPLAAAAVITLAAILLVPNHDRRRHPELGHVAATELLASGPQEPDFRTLPAPGPADADGSANPAAPSAGLASANDFPALRVRGGVTVAACPTLELPVQAGDASLGWITRAILTDHRLPRHDAVRLEEILNHFKLRPDGSSVVVRQPASNWHPDDRSLGTSTHAATIATETMACPWQPSASLVLVSIRGNPFSDCAVKAVFRANPAAVSRYRLLGFAQVVGQPQAPLPTRLPAQSGTTLVLEIQPAANAASPTTSTTDFGRSEWSANDQPAESLTLSPPDDNHEPSADARFAALVCTFAQWLTNDPSATIDMDMLAALARQNAAAPSLPADRADFLNLIDRALKL